MTGTKKCEETIGLFVLRSCDATMVQECVACNKPVCATHAFKPVKSQNGKPKVANLCLSCFAEQDTRLTKNIEVYSKDRYVWRRKMIQRFQEEYQYMVFIAEDYGTLFMGDHHHIYDDMDDNTSFFDS